MMAFPSMIAAAARQAGMKVPDDKQIEEDSWRPTEFPHFAVFCNVQLGVPVTWGNHWENAKIIAKIPDDKIKTTTPKDLEKLGFSP